MTDQEFYDKTIAHLVKQGKRAYIEGKGCLYRGPEGTTCAVGFHIPDEYYAPSMEARPAKEVLRNFPSLQPLVPYTYLASQLQTLHDTDGHWEEGGLSSKGKSYAKTIAKQHGLTPYNFDKAEG